MSFLHLFFSLLQLRRLTLSSLIFSHSRTSLSSLYLLVPYHYSFVIRCHSFTFPRVRFVDFLLSVFNKDGLSQVTRRFRSSYLSKVRRQSALSSRRRALRISAKSLQTDHADEFKGEYRSLTVSQSFTSVILGYLKETARRLIHSPPLCLVLLRKVMIDEGFSHVVEKASFGHIFVSITLLIFISTTNDKFPDRFFNPPPPSSRLLCATFLYFGSYTLSPSQTFFYAFISLRSKFAVMARWNRDEKVTVGFRPALRSRRKSW